MRSRIQVIGLIALILSVLAQAQKCNDNSKWKTNGKENGCAWVKREPTKRCKRWGVYGSRSREGGAQRACKATCGTCACVDSQTWSLKSKTVKTTEEKKLCEWVGRKKKRCETIGQDGTVANSACQLSCNTCPDSAKKSSASTKETLMAFYYSTGGNSWSNQQNWGKLDVDYCDWFGIVCVKNKIRIVLNDNNLSGSIPPEIGSFKKQLAALDLTKNKISGIIPNEIGRLVSMKKISIHENNISGSIPIEIGQMKMLQIVQLRDNNLTGSIPSEIGMLKQATAINLSDNSLSGTIPSELGELSNLNAMILTENDISGYIAVEVCDANIKNLYVDDNVGTCT